MKSAYVISNFAARGLLRRAVGLCVQCSPFACSTFRSSLSRDIAAGLLLSVIAPLQWSNEAAAQNSSTGVLWNQGGVVVDPVSPAWNFPTQELRIGPGAAGTLTVGSGGTVRGQRIFVGESAGGNGTMTVDGGRVEIGAMTVGLANGQGILHIQNGGQVITDPTVTPERDVHFFRVGYQGGTGSVLVESGGHLKTVRGEIGSTAGSSGTVTVNNATWDAWLAGVPGQSVIEVGGSGVAGSALHVQAGGKVTTGSVTFSRTADSTITGAGTVLQSGCAQCGGSQIVVGANYTSNVTVSDGARMEGGSLVLGAYGGTGQLRVTGATTVVDLVNTFAGASGSAAIGAGFSGTGNGHLIVENQALLSALASLSIGTHSNLGTGKVEILSGGRITSASGTVGLQGTGELLIDGVGSSWIASGLIDIAQGANSTGTATITQNGLLQSGTSLTVGVGANSNGTLTASDNARVAVGTRLTLGAAATATGTMTVESGSQVTSTQGVVGASGTGTLTIRDAGTSWVLTDYMDIASGANSRGNVTVTQDGLLQAGTGVFVGWGASAVGTLTVSSAGRVTSANATIGNSGTGNVFLTGANSSFTMTGFYRAGGAANGVGITEVADNAQLSVGGLMSLGHVANGRGELTVHDLGQVQANQLAVGNAGTGKLTVTGAGSIVTGNDYVDIGSGANSHGEATVTQGGILRSNEDLNIAWGAGSQGTLDVTAGGEVSANDATIGRNGTGTVNIDGAGSSFTTTTFYNSGRHTNGVGNTVVSNNGLLSVGTLLTLGEVSSSTGRLTVQGQGQAQANQVRVANAGRGELLVSGAGSSLNSTTSVDIAVASTGRGEVTVTQGGTINATTSVNAGLAAGSIGTLLVSDAGLFNSNSAAIGILGQGGVRVTGAGSKFETAAGYQAGTGSGGVGSTIVENGSELLVGTLLNLGVVANGTGSLTVQSAAQASANAVTVGDLGTGSVLVTGANSRLTSATGVDIALGTGSSGQATVAQGGFLDVTTALRVGVASGTNGALVLQSAGRVAANSAIVGDAGTGSLGVTGQSSLFETATSYISGNAVNAVGNTVISDRGRLQVGTLLNLGSVASSAGYMWVQQGGIVDANDVIFGDAGEGQVFISGANSRLTSANDVEMGRSAGGFGRAVVSTGGQLQATGDIHVGLAGSLGGQLIVSDGGLVSAQNVNLGASGIGSLVMAGTGSTLTATGAFAAGTGVGGFGLLQLSDNSRLNVTGAFTLGDTAATYGAAMVDSGARVTTSELIVGALGQAQLLISGAGSRVTSTGNIELARGTSSDGGAVVSSGGRLEAGGNLTLARAAPSNAFLSVSGGSTVASVGAVVGLGGTATLNVFESGSALTTTGALQVGGLAGGSGAVNVINGGRI